MAETLVGDLEGVWFLSYFLTVKPLQRESSGCQSQREDMQRRQEGPDARDGAAQVRGKEQADGGLCLQAHRRKSSQRSACNGKRRAMQVRGSCCMPRTKRGSRGANMLCGNGSWNRKPRYGRTPKTKAAGAASTEPKASIYGP